MSAGVQESVANACAPPRCAGDVIAVPYRQAGLIALCTLLGAAVSLLLYLRQPHDDASTAKVGVQAEQPGSPSLLSRLAQARQDLRQSEDRIVALLVQDGGRPAGSGRIGSAHAAAESCLRLDLDPGLAVAGGRSTPAVAALNAQTLELQLRLDEARQLDTDAAGTGAARNLRIARSVPENTQLEAELNRLERARRLAQERFVELQGKLDRIDLSLGTGAEGRVIIEAPDRPAVAEGKKKIVALLGPLAGLLLGLLLAALRELGGDRMRSPHEAERALGVPVLGAIPTLSAKARSACLQPPMSAQPAAATELA